VDEVNRRARWSLSDVAQLGRTSLVGVTLVITLQGVASSTRRASAADVVVALAAAAAFHAAVYMWNDLVDLPIDRTDPRRAASPLVRGMVSPTAVAVASTSFAAVAVLVAATAGVAAAVSMALALVLLGAYDLWSKSSVFPPLMDLVQGLGWAALAWFGAAMPGASSTATVWLAVFLTIAILLFNGVLGGIRDLANDAEHGARTTALLLGARAGADGVIHMPARVILYADVLHVAQVVALLIGMMTVDTSPWRISVLLAGAGVGGWVLLRGVLRRAGDRARALRTGFGYFAVMLLAPCLLVADGIGFSLGALTVVVFAVPWLCSRWLRATVRELSARRRAHVGL
jgi:4-hydroxybenzoate polyprenyltransferase